jgi:hypothetical protein
VLQGPGADVVATYDGGQSTTADVDRAVLALTAAEREARTRDASGLESLIREIVVDRLLLAEARARGPVENAQLGAAVLEEERDATANLCVAGRIPEPKAPAEDELRRIYERNRSLYRREARRLVFHIFLRQRAGTSRQNVRDRAEKLRQRVLDGESFSRVAKEESDSESRQLGGLLGWLSREDCPGDLGDVVFSLAVQQPSAPVGTRDGFHLFYVESAFEEKRFSFEEMRVGLLQRELAVSARRRSELTERSSCRRTALFRNRTRRRGLCPRAILMRFCFGWGTTSSERVTPFSGSGSSCHAESPPLPLPCWLRWLPPRCFGRRSTSCAGPSTGSSRR